MQYIISFTDWINFSCIFLLLIIWVNNIPFHLQLTCCIYYHFRDFVCTGHCHHQGPTRCGGWPQVSFVINFKQFCYFVPLFQWEKFLLRLGILLRCKILTAYTCCESISLNPCILEFCILVITFTWFVLYLIADRHFFDCLIFTEKKLFQNLLLLKNYYSYLLECLDLWWKQEEECV